MKNCLNPICMQLNTNDQDTVCPYCGTPYENAAPQKKKRTNGAKKAGLIAGMAVGAVALVAVIIFAVTGIFGNSALGTAAENSIASLADQLGSQSNLSSYMENMETLNAKSDRHILLGIQTPDVFLALDTDYAGSKKLMTGTVEFRNLQDEFQLSADFHANKKEVRIYADDLVTDIYGFTFKDFQKKYDKSGIRKALKLPEAKDLKMEPYKGFDLEKFLKEQCGDSWKEFEKTLEVEKFDTRPITLGSRTEECTIYRVQWDEKKAERMLKTLARNTLGFLPDFVPELATKLAPDVRFYVDSEEKLVGINFSFLNSIYTFLLEGENNPWEQASLQIETAGVGTVYYNGGVVTEGDDVRIELKAENETVYAVYYNNSTGAYSIVTPTGELSNGVFLSNDSGFRLESNFYNFSYVIAVSELDRYPEKTDSKYVDLFDMSFNESTRLLTEVCSSLGITMEDLIAVLSSLFGG